MSDSASVASVVTQVAQLNSGDTAWMLVSSALVLLMTPGLSLFYAGLVPSRSAINTMNMSFICLAVIPIVWAIAGYSFAFSPGNSIFGGFDYLFLNHVSSNVAANSTIPEYIPMLFQMMFAIVTPALISGALVGRMKFKAYVLFVAIWSLTVYSLLAHWIWTPTGWLAALGAIDFAGGTVVHINAGFSALVATYMLAGDVKKERAKGELPHNVPFVMLGCSLLWFGWFGFNAGSAITAGGIASLAFTTTTLATAAAAFTWTILCWLRGAPVTAVGSAVAVVIGLVAITPAAGFVSPMSSILIGICATVICYFAILYKNKILTSIQDPLDVFICHGISGVVGSLLTGVFASTLINPSSPNGLLYGNPSLLLKQSIAVISTIIVCSLGTAIIIFLLKHLMVIQPTKQDIESGIDVLEHGESAYEELSTLVQDLSISKKNLEDTNIQLVSEISERQKAEAQSITLNDQLVVAARRAGMADIATSVLHNIGNVLNSINTSIGMINEKINTSKISKLKELTDLISQHQDNIGDFITNNPQGQPIPKYLSMLSETWNIDKTNLLNEVNSLSKNVLHIRSIISMQQSLSGAIGFTEEISIEEIIKDALTLNKTAYERAHIEISYDYKLNKKVIGDRVKLLQIIVNLIKNSIDSLLESKEQIRKLTLRLYGKEPSHFVFQISDNGIGILPENITKIFTHGFTTKKTGHGFGLHTSALAAQEMGGNLLVNSDGLGAGATFTLTLPLQPVKK